MHRFLFEELGGAGVLLDLTTGCYYQLNAAAMEIGQRLAQGEPLGPGTLPGEPTSSQQRVGVRFDHVPDGFHLVLHGRPVLWLNRNGSAVRRLAETTDPAQTLLWALPHVLALRGHAVLHAAAVCWEDRVVAIGGPTGAGKSTLAKALVAAGAELVADDLLPVDPFGRVPRAGERAIREWVARQAESEEIDCSDLDAIFEDLISIKEIWYLDATRRRESGMSISIPAPVDALTTMLANSFAELNDEHVWSRIFESARRLWPLVREVTVPDGVEALHESVTLGRAIWYQ